MYAFRQLVLAAAASLAATPQAIAWETPANASKVVIVESGAAGGKIDRGRVAAIVGQACLELHVEPSAVPEIVFIHLSDEEAQSGGVPAGTQLMVERSFLNVERTGQAAPARFLVWVVGKASDQKIVPAVAHVLRLHLGLELSEAELLSAEKRILLRLDATVPVNSLLK